MYDIIEHEKYSKFRKERPSDHTIQPSTWNLMGRRLDLFPAGSDFPAGPTLSPLNIMESVGSTGPTKRFHGPEIIQATRGILVFVGRRETSRRWDK